MHLTPAPSKGLCMNPKGLRGCLVAPFTIHLAPIGGGCCSMNQKSNTIRMWSVSCSQARKRQWTVPLQVNCADVYAQNPTMETINAAIVRVFLYPFVVLRTYTACLKAWTLRTTFQGFHWIFSAAPRLPHEVRVCNHLMLCSFGQQNQDMIIRGLNGFLSFRESRWSRWVE